MLPQDLEQDREPEPFEIDWEAVWQREAQQLRQEHTSELPPPRPQVAQKPPQPKPPAARPPQQTQPPRQQAAPREPVYGQWQQEITIDKSIFDQRPPVNQGGKSALSAWDDETMHLPRAPKPQPAPIPRATPPQAPPETPGRAATMSPPRAQEAPQESARAQRARQAQGARVAAAQEAGAKKGKKPRKWVRNALLTWLVLVGFYCVAVFSNIPFVAKWRAIYIETAMGTMTHQWLATAFIPPGVIENVMGQREQVEENQQGLESDWGNTKPETDTPALAETKWDKLQKEFFAAYPEVDRVSFEKYLAKNQEESLDEKGYLMIDKAGVKDGGTEIDTIHGDQVLAVDTRNGILICKVTGEGFVGRLAIVRDPAQVGVALASGYGSTGSFATDIAQKRDAVLLTNASGFYDPEGHGNGGVAHGLVVSGGKRQGDPVGGTYKTIGIDEENRLHVGQFKNNGQFRDAVEFKPALIVNGEQVVKGSAGWGVQPRTAIGQAEDGTMLILVIDGRSPGYSIGATVGDCAEILAKYGAVQACNLDGGSSSIMVYNGREISRPSAANKEKGRHIPNGIAVYEK